MTYKYTAVVQQKLIQRWYQRSPHCHLSLSSICILSRYCFSTADSSRHLIFKKIEYVVEGKTEDEPTTHLKHQLDYLK
jgi:hypothetical protein